MRSLLTLSVSVVLVAVLLQLTDAVPVKRPERTPQQCPEMDSDWIDRIWSAYKNKFDRTYSEQEDDTRRQIFVQNVWTIAKHNVEEELGLHTYKVGFNDFSDWTDDELSGLYGGLMPNPDDRR